MSNINSASLSRLPSVDEVMRTACAGRAVSSFGRPATVAAVRNVLSQARAAGRTDADSDAFAGLAFDELDRQSRPNLRRIFNLTGTVLHTNLGRALLAEAAIAAANVAMRNAVALEFDIAGGRRGERDDLVQDLLCELTGAEAATVVNNNAAAVLLMLNALSHGREVIVSRGELIEIGGAFRLPEIMTRAGAKLKEIGTTNRTHLKDYAGALGPKSALILKVHTSNYRIEGFTKEVSARELAGLAKEHGVPLAHDLGSGTLVDLRAFGLAHEPTVADAIADGADLVTFSGDKLLGGPQAGLIVGRKTLIDRINKNPMKRALRVDKIRLAALEATLRLYRDPDRLAETVPTYKAFARPMKDMQATADRVLPVLQDKLGRQFLVQTAYCASQVGSGALPIETLPSLAIAVTPALLRGSGRVLKAAVEALRALPVPVVGRIEDGVLLLDLRCLDDVDDFVANLGSLRADASSPAQS